MTPTAVLRNVLRILAPLCVLLTTYLYLYPVFLGCAFPLSPQAGGSHNGGSPQPTNSISSAAFHSTIQQHLNASYPHRAPFRLLALGDPQLEGDSSIPNYGFNPFWHLEWSFKHLTFRTNQPNFRLRIKQAVHDIVDFFLDDIPLALESLRKRIDLWGNDYYLAHIYRTLRWWTKPTHVTVLGDLLGSQWVSDEEFERRSWRFWNRSFMGAERVPDHIAMPPAEDYNLAGFLGNDYENDENAAAWRRRVINVVGNHDIGYAGDITQDRITRFERAFGKTGYELRFELPLTNQTSNATVYNKMTNPASNRLVPELRLVIINNMNLDTPAADQSLQDKSYGFLNSAISTGSSVEFKGHFTIVLTHIPMYKPAGICVDAPFFDFFEDTGGVKEQNQLSPDASKGFLEGIYGLSGNKYAPGGGMGRRGVIMNGHDHEGCDTWHWINQTVEMIVAETPVAQPAEVAQVAGVLADAPAVEAVEAEKVVEGIPMQYHPIRGISLRAQGLSENGEGQGEAKGEQLLSSDQPTEHREEHQKQQPEEPAAQLKEQGQQAEVEERQVEEEQDQHQHRDDNGENNFGAAEGSQQPQEQETEEQQSEEHQPNKHQHREQETEEKEPTETQTMGKLQLEKLADTDASEQLLENVQPVESEQKEESHQNQEQGQDQQPQEQAPLEDHAHSEEQPQHNDQIDGPQEQQTELKHAQDENQQQSQDQQPEPQQPPPPPPPPPAPEPPKPEWRTSLYTTALTSNITTAPQVPGIRELTVRSMMGDFGGNAGLLSAWFDEEDWEWKFEFVTCALGRQYMWWFVHSCDFALVFLGTVYLVLLGCLRGGLWGEDKWPESWTRWAEGQRRGWVETVERVMGVVGMRRVDELKKVKVTEEMAREKARVKKEEIDGATKSNGVAEAKVGVKLGPSSE